MIAAVAAIVACGGFAACTYEPVPAQDAAWAYTWKFTGKTTTGAALKGKAGVATACGYTSGGRDDSFVRVPASLKLQGYTWYCDPGCGCTDFETALAEVNELFYIKKPFKGSLTGGVTMEVSNIIGKKAKQYEVAGKANFTGTIDANDPRVGADEMTFDLVFAGLGKYDKKNSRVSSASGNFAGIANYPWYVSKTVCAPAGIWDCDVLAVNCDTFASSVAYGKWSVKFYKSAAKKLAANKVSTASAIKSPKWVVWANAL